MNPAKSSSGHPFRSVKRRPGRNFDAAKVSCRADCPVPNLLANSNEFAERRQPAGSIPTASAGQLALTASSNCLRQLNPDEWLMSCRGNCLHHDSDYFHSPNPMLVICQITDKPTLTLALDCPRSLSRKVIGISIISTPARFSRHKISSK
jgi:hypothetical protein